MSRQGSVCNFWKLLGYSGEVRGILEIKFILEEGLFANILKVGVILQKAKRVEGSFKKKRKGGGVFGKIAIPFLPPTLGNRGGVPGVPAAADLAVLDHGGGRGWGKKG